MIYIDLPADLNLEDDHGRNVARLADAVTPNAVMPVTVLAAGAEHAWSWATVTLYRDTIAKALREELGSVELTKLTAGAVQKALADLAARCSTRTVQMAHNVLVRAIRHAERDDLVGRNVAALVKPPNGHRAAAKGASVVT